MSARCKTCKKAVWNTVDGECQGCYLEFQCVPKHTDVKVPQEVDFDRLEWFSYILRRAIANREPKTAWDAAVCITGHFQNVYGEASQEVRDSREIG